MLLATGAIRWLTFSGFWVAGCHFAGEAVFDPAAIPKWQEGRHPHCHFRGLLRLYLRYGPSDRSATQGDLCHEAPAQPVTPLSRSSATGPIDNYPGGTFLH